MLYTRQVNENATAAEDIPALSCVKWVSQSHVVVAKAADRRVEKLGFVETAVLKNASVSVILSGEAVGSSWTWTPNAPLWIGADGHLTATQNDATASIGYAVTATKVVVDPTIALVESVNQTPAFVHTHDNKAVLDGITSTEVADWNQKVDPAPVDGKLYGSRNGGWVEITTP